MNQEVDIRCKGFSQIPHVLIDSGILAKLTPSEFKVWAVINSYISHRTGFAFPSVKRISKLSGLCENTVSRATNGLFVKGLIEKKRVGERFSFKMCYRLIKDEEKLLQLASCIAPKKTVKCKSVARGKDGRFVHLPEDTGNRSPVDRNTHYTEDTGSSISSVDTVHKKTKKNKKSRDQTVFCDNSQIPKSKDQINQSQQEVLSEGSKKKLNPRILNVMIRRHGISWVRKLLADQGYDRQQIKSLQEVE